MRRFDQKRPGRRTSNQEWKNPHDPQAKVRRTKDGACAMIYKFDMGTVIGDVHAARRRKQGLAAPLRRALRRAACAVNGQSGKALLRKRGMHLERSFEHVLHEAPAALARTPRTRMSAPGKGIDDIRDPWETASWPSGETLSRKPSRSRLRQIQARFALNSYSLNCPQ